MMDPIMEQIGVMPSVRPFPGPIRYRVATFLEFTAQIKLLR